MADDHGRAIGVIVRQLARARGQQADDDFTARTILQALIGHGWRPRIEAPPGPPKAAVPPTDEWKAIRAAIEPQRHADHGPDVICRPALGPGLCEPLPDGRG